MKSDQNEAHLSPGRPSAQQSQAITGRILDAAQQLFVEQGYEPVSMDIVAKVAHISKRTLYERYFGKAELLKAVIDRAFTRKLMEFDRISRPNGRIQHVLGSLSDQLVEMITDPIYGALHRILAAEQHRFPGLFERHSLASSAKMAQIVSEVLADPKVAGVANFDDPARAGEYFVIMVVAPTARRLQTHDRKACAEFNRQAISIFLNGMSTRQSGEQAIIPTAAVSQIPERSTTKGKILDAAVKRFAAASYENVGLRDIAHDVGVDIAYVQRSFGSKMGLFHAALEAVARPDLKPVWSLGQGLPDAIVQMMKAGGPASSPQLALAITLQSLTSPTAGSVVSGRLSRDFVDPMAAALPAPGNTRASLIAALLIGIGVSAHLFDEASFKSDAHNLSALLHIALTALVTEPVPIT